MKIVGKAAQNPENGPIDRVEYYLPEYRRKIAEKGKFTYAWTFNPDNRAINAMRDNSHDLSIYLIDKPYQITMKFNVEGFRHNRSAIYCPQDWREFCITEEWGINEFPDTGPIHIWFLINEIESIPPMDIRNNDQFIPYFPDKFKTYGQKHFAFYI